MKKRNFDIKKRLFNGAVSEPSLRGREAPEAISSRYELVEIAQPVPSSSLRLLRSSLRDSLAMTSEESPTVAPRNDSLFGLRKQLLNLFIALFLGIFVSTTYLWAQSNKKEYGIIINLAGKERMLTQKMVKETLLIYAEIDVEKNRDNLRETVELFTKTLKGLRDGDTSLRLPSTKSELIKSQIDKVSSMFQEVGFIFERINKGEIPSWDAVMELAEKEPSLLENMNIIVEMYEGEARGTMPGREAFLGIEINLAGKQRMLTQKMAKEALLIYLDIDRRKNKKLLHETYELFDKTLKGLKYGDGDLGLPAATEGKIAKQIDAVMKLWSELKPIIERSSDIMVDKISREELETLATLNVLLLEEMDRIVTMYEELAKRDR